MSILDHTWGESPYRDRVWSLVNGLGRSRAGKRLLAVWQAYIDESIDEETFVLGGFVAPASAWSDFTGEWENLLPYTRLRSTDGSAYRFKMSEMAANAERLERAQAFFRIIEKYVSFGLVLSIRVSDLHRARKRLILIDKELGLIRPAGDFYQNDYSYAFYIFMISFEEHRSQADKLGLVDAAQKVDFIFDNRMHDKKSILSGWQDWIEKSEYGPRYGATPMFVSDDEFLPVQAADFLCWWVREWVAETPTIGSANFPWSAHRDMKIMHHYMTEDRIFEQLSLSLTSQREGLRVYDRNTLIGVPPSAPSFGSDK